LPDDLYQISVLLNSNMIEINLDGHSNEESVLPAAHLLRYLLSLPRFLQPQHDASKAPQPRARIHAHLTFESTSRSSG
jgi:hypothetical protein